MANSADILATASIDTHLLDVDVKRVESGFDRISRSARTADKSLANFGSNAGGLGKLDGKFSNITQKAVNLTQQLASGASLVETLGAGALAAGSKFGLIGTAIGAAVFSLTKMVDKTGELEAKAERAAKAFEDIKQAEADISRNEENARLSTISRIQGPDAADDAKRRFDYEKEIERIRKSDLDIATKANLTRTATAAYEAENLRIQEKRQAEIDENRKKELETIAEKWKGIQDGIDKRDREAELEDYARLDRRIAAEKKAAAEIARIQKEFAESLEADEIAALDRKISKEKKRKEDAAREAEKAADEAKRQADDEHRKRIDRMLMPVNERQAADREERRRERAERTAATRDRLRRESKGHSIRGKDVPEGHKGRAAQGGLNTGTLRTGNIVGASIIVSEIRHR